MVALYIVGGVAALAVYLGLGAVVGYWLAPSVGYLRPEERNDWRLFGWNWGILGVLVCWLFCWFARHRAWAFHPLGCLCVLGAWALVTLLLPRWSAGLPWLVLVWIVCADNRQLTGAALGATSFLTFFLGPIGYLFHAVRRHDQEPT